MKKQELKLSVGKGRVVDTEIKNINIKNLHFYPQNPRISSVLIDHKGKLTDDIIHKLMRERQPKATKTLYRRIKEEGNLNEALIVYQNQTLEGNTRLWVLRELYKNVKNKKGKKKWGIAPCRVIKEKLSESEIDFILCNVHIKKKKDWQPFEQACYFYRMYNDEGRSYNQISKLTGFNVNKIIDYIKSFQEMKKRKAKSEEFNYYYETIRQPEVKKEINKGKIKVFEVLQKKIKQQKIKTAKDVRKISTILKDEHAKKMFFEGEENIYRAEEAALVTNPQEGDPLLKRIKGLQEDLKHIPLEKLQDIEKDKTKMKIIVELKEQIKKLCRHLKINF